MFSQFPRQFDYAASVWAVMDRFGCPAFAELNGTLIHRLENVMTLEVNAHLFFDELEIYFESTVIDLLDDIYKSSLLFQDVPHNYRIRGFQDSVLRHLPTHVTLSSTNPALPLPNPKYLALHAACAKVAHLSGAGEHLDAILREMETTNVLSQDGRSFEVLEYAMLANLKQVAVC
jgi:hypothetical protein